ncbi:helix-turn-helix transcriptional regulator [Leisingera sp. ANG59]|uniref:helix-turn-helix transcriptional regulator n=1 Tax=Leisingera sp. ANG59 TaxID=2675221 RepID=UPI00157426E9|nr:helix-turn-helix transcriptional regulator [Leisingera sp. ANG59]NSY40901.1 hypothetical protein [Leisingera sp. ANG59]
MDPAFLTTTKIYDTVTDFGNWTPALDSLCHSVGARAGALLLRDYGENPYTISALSTVYVRMFERGNGQHFVDNLMHYESQQWDYVGQMKIGTVYRDEEMSVDRAVLDNRPDYLHLKQHAGILRRIICGLNRNNGWFDAVALGFPLDVGFVPDPTMRRLSWYLPHLTKTIEIGRTFNFLRVKYNAVLTVLNQINIGIILALENGEVLLANKEAERLLDENDGLLRNRKNLISCANFEQNAALRTYIQEVAQTANGEANTAHRHLALARRSGESPLLVDVTPVRDASDELNAQLRGSIIIVIDPDQTEALQIDKFAGLYRLSKAETHVCELLLRGHTAHEIAEIRGTTHNTSRNQIQAIYSKTATKRRSDLVRLILRILPPIL